MDLFCVLLSFSNVYCIQCFTHFPMFYLLLWGVKTLCDLSPLSAPRWGEVLETETTSSSVKMFRCALEILFNSWSSWSPESANYFESPSKREVERLRAEGRGGYDGVLLTSLPFTCSRFFHLLPFFFHLLPENKLGDKCLLKRNSQVLLFFASSDAQSCVNMRGSD